MNLVLLILKSNATLYVDGFSQQKGLIYFLLRWSYIGHISNIWYLISIMFNEQYTDSLFDHSPFLYLPVSIARECAENLILNNKMRSRFVIYI